MLDFEKYENGTSTIQSCQNEATGGQFRGKIKVFVLA